MRAAREVFVVAKATKPAMCSPRREREESGGSAGGRLSGPVAQPNGLDTISTKPGRSGARWSRLMGAAAAPAPPLLSAAAIAWSCNRQRSG